MRPLPAVVELMSGELVAGAEALAAALAGEGFLPSQRNVPARQTPTKTFSVQRSRRSPSA